MVRLNGQEILKRKSVQYLGCLIHKDREIEEDVNNKIKVGWMKWRSPPKILCDSRILTKLKENFIRLL